MTWNPNDPWAKIEIGPFGPSMLTPEIVDAKDVYIGWNTNDDGKVVDAAVVVEDYEWARLLEGR